MSDLLLAPLLRDAIQARHSLLDAAHECAVRLFNGFSEGFPALVVDLYGRTAVLHNYADPPADGEMALAAAQEVLVAALPWVKAVLIKNRNSQAHEDRIGALASGHALDDRIREEGLSYALDLRLHQDCSLYLDTRNVRHWAREHLLGKTVLNAFAYTGSLGIASLGGGASSVVQLDRSRQFLQIARRSYALNHFAIRARDFLTADFFRETARFRRQHQTYDCVFLDPPFFSSSAAGVVDQENNSARLINKARPLVSPGGSLVVINNAVYVSGHDYMHTLEDLSRDGYLQVEEILPVPGDFAGMLPASGANPITDPAPFNHSTKIAVLRVRA